MIALEGIYDNGALMLEKSAPIKKAKVLVIFPDKEEEAEKEDIIKNKKTPKRNDAFMKALENDRFVIHTGLNVEEYMKELRDNDRI